MKYEEFEPASYTEFRRWQLSKKGAEESQVRFLMALRSSSEGFCKWLTGKVDIASGERLSVLSNPLTESEFKEPPKFTESQIHDEWSGLIPAISCRTSFWGLVTFRHIEAGLLEPSYLAAGGGSGPTGAERIDQLLQDPITKQKEIDSVVRTALRRLGGLPEARGNRTIYVDCPFARAWWRGYLAADICKDVPDADKEETKKNIIKVLRQSQAYWEGLVNLVVSRGSVLGDLKVRNALVLVLAQCLSDGSLSSFEGDKAKTLVRFRRAIGIRSAWQELGVFSIDELKEIIKKIIGA